MTIAFVGAGEPTYANNTSPIAPALHASVAENNITFGIFFMEDQASTWGSAPAGWAHITGSPFLGSATNSEINLAIVWRVQPATPEAPSLTQDAVGAGSITAYTLSFSGSFSTAPIDLIGALLSANYGGGSTIGPISGIGPIAEGAVALAIGCHGDSVTDHTTLSDGSLTWNQAAHGSTLLGADSACWADYAITTGGPTVANQTFTVSGADMTKDSGGIIISFYEDGAAGSSALPLLNAYYYG